MRNHAIYLILQGRIGNQLFQYAFARHLQLKLDPYCEIVIDDSRVLNQGWENSLVNYNLPNVRYTHEDTMSKNRFSKQFLLRGIYKLATMRCDYMTKFLIEKRFNKFANKWDVFLCENGYMENALSFKHDILLDGFFQSEKYFYDNRELIKETLSGRQFAELDSYPGIQEIRNRNSVCISVKVEHNIGSSLYDVCSINYWKSAIDAIVEQVENPLFFICSDNVSFVLENLIDASRFDYIVQDVKEPVHVSLAAMSECKHFIIGNTTYGWWAQYLSKNKDKIVIAPSKWMAIEMPIDIYQGDWTLVTV